MPHPKPFTALTLLRYRPRPGRITLPDVCCDVVWFGGRAHLAGPMGEARPAVGAGEDVTVLRLDPLIAHRWIGVPLRCFTDQIIPLADVNRAIDGELKRWFESGRLSDLVQPDVGHMATPHDRRLGEAGLRLKRGETVGAVAAALAIGERQLERIFAEAMGLSPKKFARILRLRRSLVTAAAGARLAEAATDGGYADQAHFSREVRDFTGQSARPLLRDVGNVQDIVAGTF